MAFAAISFLIVSCTQSKVGYVDVEEVMTEYDAAKSVEEQLKLEQEEMSKSLDSLTAPFQLKVQEFYQNAEKMSISKRQAKEQELQQENQLLQQQQQQAQQFLQQKGIAEIATLTAKIDSAVANYASANNFQMIMATQGTGQVMYGDDNSNLTETIIDILNAEFELNN